MVTKKRKQTVSSKEKGKRGKNKMHTQTKEEKSQGSSSKKHESIDKPHSNVDDMVIDADAGFDGFMLDARLRKAIERLGWKHPTLVQSHGVPLALQGRDILAKARTGSGKTAAYLLPTMQKILSRANQKSSTAKESGVQALILVPTRDLCPQVANTVKELAYYCARHVRVLALGQADPTDEKLRLKELPEIIIATPGRIVLHVKAGNIQLKNSLETFVIDEADLVLFHGHGSDVSFLVPHLSSSCQNFLMSATLSDDVETLREMVLHNPAVLKLEEEEDQEEKKDGVGLTEFYYVMKPHDKLLVLYTFIQLSLLKGKTLVFVRNIGQCFRLKLFLERFSIRSAVLNSELPHASRRHMLEQFNRGIFKLLIASAEDDLIFHHPSKAKGSKDEDDPSPQKSSISKSKIRRDASYGVGRGFDFKNVANVVNYDIPESLEQYVHQVGRTARAGESGTAMTLVDENDAHQNQVWQKIKSNRNVRKYQMDSSIYESFRYRCEDMQRSITNALVREARIRDLKMEIVNSEKLRAQLEDNPQAADMILRDHDSNLQPVKPLANLKEVPSYLVSDQSASDLPTITGKRKRITPFFSKKALRRNSRIRQKKIRDPLKYLALNPDTPKRSATFHGIRGDDDIAISKGAKAWRKRNLKVHQQKEERPAFKKIEK